LGGPQDLCIDYNRRVNPPESHVALPARIDPVLIGTLLSAASALGYTAANICLRDVADTCDPTWVSCIKAVPTAAVAWLLIAQRAARGLPALPTGRAWLPLVVTALCMQLGGNVCFQWSLGVLGLALSVPLVFGALILGGALAGRIWLSEGITPRAALAMMLLILAVGILSWGAERDQAPVGLGPKSQPASAPLHDAPRELPRYSTFLVALAVGAACFSGLCYAACNAVIRRMTGPTLPLSAALMVMSTTGVVSLGLLSLWQLGPVGIAQTSSGEWLSMSLAGIFNAAAFFALGQALQLIPLTRSNLIAATQVALSSLAGVVLFGERLTPMLGVGLALTLLGLVTMQRRE
jgi:drug/metabolite transporter (DMT)-like permease